MSDNAVDLAEEATALRLLADAIYARSKELSERAAKAMGSRGTLYPSLPDGTELASFIVPADAETVDVDVDVLLPFVQQHYPTEVMATVRPAFVERIRASSKEAKQACGPGGELDVPGVTYWLKPGSPRITAKPEGRERARAAVDAVLTEALTSFAVPQIEGVSDGTED